MIISSTTLISSALPEILFVDADSQDAMNVAQFEVVLLFTARQNLTRGRIWEDFVIFTFVLSFVLDKRVE